MPDSPAEPSDIEPKPKPAGSAQIDTGRIAALTEGEAREIAQGWVDSHPFQLGSSLDPGSRERKAKGEEYYSFSLGIIGFGTAEILVNKETIELFHYRSPGNAAFEPLDDWYNREHRLRDPVIITYGGKPITPLMGKSLNEAVSILGAPEASSEDDRGVVQSISYGGIVFWISGGCLDSLESYDPGALEANGASLDKNRAGLVGLLGTPAHEGWSEGAYGAENVFYMSYDLTDCWAYFEFLDGPDSTPYMVLITYFQWTTVSCEGVRVDIPPTWSYDFPDLGPPGHDIRIRSEDGAIEMYIGYILAGNPYDFLEENPHTVFLFDSMEEGYMVHLPDRIMFVHAGWLSDGIELYHDGDLSIFTDNEATIWRIVKSLQAI